MEIAALYMNVELPQACIDIPVEFQIDHNLYKKRILTKYPNVAKFKWEKLNAKISEPKIICFIKHVINRGPNYFLRKIGKQNILAAGMNPSAYWLQRDEKACVYWNEYFNKSYPRLQ